MTIEAVELWEEYQETGDVELRNRLVEKYFPIVKQVSNRMIKGLPGCVTQDDLESAGSFGLIRAVERFDYRRGVKFKTYCKSRIRGAILDELRERDWIPRLIRHNTSVLTSAQEKLERELGREPTADEIAERLEVSHERVEMMIRESEPIGIITFSCWKENLSSKERTDDKTHNPSTMCADPAAQKAFERFLLKDSVRELIESLTDQERMVVSLYYAEGLIMKEVSRVLRLTESRVCRIHANALEKLRMRKTEQAREALQTA